uniref:Uncharacterized protein n=1 Tax=Arion vulgaris TaxID=1028688 RepID=A0A0B6ZZG6_9EUPU
MSTSQCLNLSFQVVNAVLESGEILARKRKIPIPLMYEWHDKAYLGAAHGLAGIFYMLLQVSSVCQI